MTSISALASMRVGSARRSALMCWFLAKPAGEQELPVNNKWQLKSHDPDLAYLVKKGYLRQIRRAAGLRGGKGQTYLVMTEKASANKRQFGAVNHEVSAAEMLRILKQSGGKLYQWPLGFYCTSPGYPEQPYDAVPKQPWIGTVAFDRLVESKQLTRVGEWRSEPAEQLVHAS